MGICGSHHRQLELMGRLPKASTASWKRPVVEAVSETTLSETDGKRVILAEVYAGIAVSQPVSKSSFCYLCCPIGFETMGAFIARHIAWQLADDGRRSSNKD